jgi:hypothetical protein
MSSDSSIAQSPSSHLRTLGICWTVYGVIRLIMAVWLVVFSGTATVMVGALLDRMPDPFTLMSIFHLMYTAFVVLSAICGLCGLLAGLALLARQRSGRSPALVAGFLSLSDIPLGITLGIYTLIVLLPMSGSQLSVDRS